MVRIDSQDPAGRVHAYLQVKQCSQLQVQGSSCLASVRSSIRQRRNPRETADLSSIQELIREINSSCHSELLDISGTAHTLVWQMMFSLFCSTKPTFI
ncbi:hypothetical protein ACS0TY_030854 [Phlomoides rotata]